MEGTAVEYPSFDQLPLMPGTDERHSWDVFGDNHEYGCLNFITPAHVLTAARLVETGEVVNLNLPLHEPQSGFWAKRQPPDHHVELLKAGRDDYLDSFYLQGSTQWDGFRHARFRKIGYYGGHLDDELDKTDVLGIDRWAERGMIGRGVLIDAARYFGAAGGFAMDERFAISGAHIEAIAQSQRVALRDGDMLVLRTAWLGWYMGLPREDRDAMAERFAGDRASLKIPGLSADCGTAAWLWNHRVSCIASDTPMLETVPYIPAEGWAHQRILALLGLPFGELWQLDKLAEVCRTKGRYEFMLCSAPLNLRRGVGSPANAYAVF